MVSTALVMPSDAEELALNLNGKNKKRKLSDFMKSMTNNSIPEKSQLNIVNKLESAIPSLLDYVSQGFLPVKMQEKYCDIIEKRAKQLHLMYS